MFTYVHLCTPMTIFCAEKEIRFEIKTNFINKFYRYIKSSMFYDFRPWMLFLHIKSSK